MDLIGDTMRNKAFKVSNDADVAKEILNALSELETSLRDEFSKRPREY